MIPGKEKPFALQYSSSFIRDCWFEESNNNIIFVLRQIKYQDNGTSIAKEIRLVNDEIANLTTILEQYMEEKGFK